MTDFSNLSDDDLLALYEQEKAKLAPTVKAKGLSPQDQTQLGKMREAARTALGTATDAEKFVALNRKAGTGALPAVLDFPWGALTAVNPTYAQMKALAARNGPAMRPPGSGSTSDKDMKLFLSGFPSITKPGQANAAIAKDLQDNSDRAAAQAAFADVWASKRGNLMGMQAAFDDFWAKRQAGDPKANNIGGSSPAAPSQAGGGWSISRVN